VTFIMLGGRAARIALTLLFAAGCQSSPDQPNKTPPPPSSASEAASASATPPPSASASSSPAATQSASAAHATIAGTWQGDYDAKKGSVEMPPKVKDKTRSSDDGKTMAGAGKVEIVIAPDGNVRGKASGALGDATLSGTIDDNGSVLRASWFPDEPTAPNAMTGVLIGFLKDGEIRGEIRVAGPDASIVREAKINLKRK
jgi:hypothetical protein